MNNINTRKGALKVTHYSGKEQFRRDFDAEEWSFLWVKRIEVDILRLLHDRDPDATDATDAYDFVEFSTPVYIEFEHET